MVVDRAHLRVRRAADFHDQRSDALDMLDGGGVIDTPLEAVRRIGREVVLAGAALDGARPPECRFQVNAVGVQRDGSRIAAHDTGQRFDFLVVGNHADPLVQVHGATVQQLQRFALLAPADI